MLPGESEEGYLNMAERLVARLQPKDLIEQFLVRDVIDFAWTIPRLRRLRAVVWRGACAESVWRVLVALGDCDFIPDLDGSIYHFAQRWARGGPAERGEFAETLKKSGLTMDSVASHAPNEVLDAVELLDSMLDIAEARRRKTLQQLVDIETLRYAWAA